jgi:hypothetical protein
MSTVKMIAIFAMPAFDDNQNDRPTPSNPGGFRCDSSTREGPGSWHGPPHTQFHTRRYLSISESKSSGEIMAPQTTPTACNFTLRRSMNALRSVNSCSTDKQIVSGRLGNRWPRG